jgi:hypothetical protein
MNFAEAFTVCGLLMFISFLISSFKKENMSEVQYRDELVKLKIENTKLTTIIEERKIRVENAKA